MVMTSLSHLERQSGTNTTIHMREILFHFQDLPEMSCSFIRLIIVKSQLTTKMMMLRLLFNI